MSLVVNNNLMAANTARNLNAHYGRLATSTQRLSSGLRINSAADDAAGLAIRELQRADIAALQQGARNANDAISMIQVADGSLGIIDEKLIRMKELAEQAATGTYDSTQRLMIESEYQAMASEITRIANATDFNGMKLLDGTLDGDHDGSGLTSTGKMKIHFGTGNDSAEDYYYITIGDCTAQAFGVGNASTWQDVQSRASEAFKDSLQSQIKASNLSDADKGALLAAIDENVDIYNQAITNATDPLNAHKYWASDLDEEGFMADGKSWVGNSNLMSDYLAVAARTATQVLEQSINEELKNVDTTINVVTPLAADDSADAAMETLGKKVKNAITAACDKLGLSPAIKTAMETAAQGKIDTLPTLKEGDDKATVDDAVSAWVKDIVDAAVDKGVEADGDADKPTVVDAGITSFWNGLRETEKQKLQYAWGQAAVYNLGNADADREPAGYGIGAGAFTFVDAVDEDSSIATAESIFNQALADAYTKVKDMDFAGFTIETQEDAQHALDAINNAIVEKDKIRAHLGATQNRLENTVSNLNIQAENLQAAESRISDVDVATEMTQFVRNQILTQSAVAMLSQANSLPQMAMQLIGG